MTCNLSAIDTRLTEAMQKKHILEELRAGAVDFIAAGDPRLETLVTMLNDRLAGLDTAVNRLLEMRGKLDPEVRALLGLPLDCEDAEVETFIRTLIDKEVTIEK